MDPNQHTLRLLSATAQGDRLAFEQLYQHTSAKLYAISIQMLRRHDLAEDAVQEAFVRIWHNAGEYQQEKGNVLTWMTTIVRYRALDMLRAAKSRRESHEDTDEGEDEQSPEKELYAERDRALIDRCMDLLETQQRQVIQLAYFRGLTHAEVCDSTGSPLGSVKTWIRRGLERLKRCIES
ncbi:MAG: sigma-70 family RNA polymerase sigma factor [Moraxellaceae bacterium]|nr:MAG: sigma-70 family RNA polymerase sigma factor [Moraxellaceae bacterium]